MQIDLFLELYTYKFKYNLANSGFFLDFQYQGSVKSTVFGLFEDLKFKISEGYMQNGSFPVSALLAVSV